MVLVSVGLMGIASYFAYPYVTSNQGIGELVGYFILGMTALAIPIVCALILLIKWLATDEPTGK